MILSDEPVSLIDWLVYIEKAHPQEIELSINRVSQVAQNLKVISFECPVVVVGGTNGKASCLAFLKSLGQAPGYRVGLYTSPHLLRVNERIEFDQQVITDEELIDCLKVVEEARESITLTYFEYLTLAALYFFKQKKPDLLLLEVGMGGRLDAVNVVENTLAVITTIALDHMAYLGPTRDHIAFEKSGIFKSNQLAVCGDKNIPPVVFEQAAQCNTALYTLGKEFDYDRDITPWCWWSTHQKLTGLGHLQLPRQNAATALMAFELLRISLSEAQIKQALENTSLPGRWQYLPQVGNCWVDVAHNPESAEYLAGKIQAIRHGRTIIAVVGMLTTKDIQATLAPLIPVVDRWYVGGLPEAKVGATGFFLRNVLQELGASQYHAHETVEMAWQAALLQRLPEELLVVLGSFYTVAAVLRN